jgi:nucleoid-associated protein YgaU
MDKETTPFQAAQPGPQDDWEYDTDPPRGRILWGRILALAVALVLAFFVGRVTAGGNGSISAASYQKVKRDLAAARATIAAQNAVPSPTTEVTPESTPTPEATDSATPQGTTYTVKSGDTLRGIATKFYGDSSLADLIAQANNITNPTLVHPGTKLLIPPKP